jgi:NADH-quinone oxidoreductase subunit M
MPLYAVVFLIVTFSSIGVPGTNGFVGEFMVLLGTFASQSLGGYATLQAVIASSGVILAAIYMLGMVQRMFFGPVSNQANRQLPDLNVRESIALAPSVVLIFVIGLFPSLFLNKTSQSVNAAIEQYRDGRRAYQELSDESTQSTLRPREGGALEKGYPDPPAGSLDAARVAHSDSPRSGTAGAQ